jgi:hypothetical protein
MPKVVFEGDSHQEIVAQVKRWLASAQSGPEGQLSVAQAIEQGAGVTKDALRIIASAAPRPVVDSDVLKALTGMGYKATDVTRDRLVQGLDQLEQMTGGSVLRMVSERGRAAVYEMNVTIAKQILKQLHGV